MIIIKRKVYLNIFSAISLAVILICILFFQGCNSNDKNKFGKTNVAQGAGEIVQAKLTDKEKQLLQGLEIDKYFIFEANIKDKNIKSLDVWTDYYENGKFKVKVSGIGTNIELPEDKDLRIIFSTQRALTEDKKERWSFGITSTNGGGRGSTVIEKSKDVISSTWSSIEKKEIDIGKDMTLAVIAEAKENGITSISVNELNGEKAIKSEAMKNVLKNNYVYIIKCKFK